MAWVSTASTHTMLACVGLSLLSLLAMPVCGVSCPAPCYCTPLSQGGGSGGGGLKVDCSQLGLREIPALPENTSELHLQFNRLTFVPPGAFDKLRDLQRVWLVDNPWLCDCRIAYLRQWLRGQKLQMERRVLCSSPASVRGRRVSRVTEEQSSCGGWWPVRCRRLAWVDMLLLAAAVLVLWLSVCTVHIAKHLSFWVLLTNPDSLYTGNPFTPAMLAACVVALLLACGCLAAPCPAPCQCTSTDPQSLMVNCSFRGLRELPAIPERTTQLYLHHNLLSTVPPGAFDRLLGLRFLSLHGNPWRCDCRIAYLRQWLRNRDPVRTREEPLCAQPEGVRARPISVLRGAGHSACLPARRHYCRAMYGRDVALCALAALLLLLLTYCLLRVRSKLFVFTPGTHRRESLSLLPLPKPRSGSGWTGRGTSAEGGGGGGGRVVNARISERPSPSPSSSELRWTVHSIIECECKRKPERDNMEILPQILTTLHTEYNIKIKAS